MPLSIIFLFPKLFSVSIPKLEMAHPVLFSDQTALNKLAFCAAVCEHIYMFHLRQVHYRTVFSINRKHLSFLTDRCVFKYTCISNQKSTDHMVYVQCTVVCERTEPQSPTANNNKSKQRTCANHDNLIGWDEATAELEMF